MVIGSPRWGVPRIPDTGSQPGPRGESSGHLGCTASRVCYLVVFSGARMDSARGGFPKNRPCRWRNIAPSPPAYKVSRKEPSIQGVGRLDPRRTLRWTPEASVAGCPARASPEYIQFLTRESRFCLSENCPADSFLFEPLGYAPAASAITLRFDRLRLNRCRLRVSAITQSPYCQC